MRYKLITSLQKQKASMYKLICRIIYLDIQYIHVSKVHIQFNFYCRYVRS